MYNFKTSNDILDFAITNEIAAYNFYTNLAAKTDNTDMKKVFLDFAIEEQVHKKHLETIKKSGTFNISDKKITDLKIAETAVDVEPTPNMKYKDILVLAMKKEKRAFQLYTDLANAASEPTAKQLFLSLAQQEAKHKLRFELEYDDIILKEN